MLGTTVQHYRIRERLGQGGMGEVFLAEDLRLGRLVALKFLAAGAQDDPDRRARFLTEAQAVSRLQSPNIAAIYDIGVHDGADYLVMEYVEGEVLSRRLKAGPLAIRDALDLASQVADALVDAHERGVVHRDVKPGNVIVTPRGQAKVLDFGLAKFVQRDRGALGLEGAVTISDSPTVAGSVLGTVAYMSPEQALGREVDERTDLFSLGVVLYEMVTGRLPFEGRTFAEIVDALLNRSYVAPAWWCPDVTPAIEAILRRALEKDAALRYQTARDLRADLRRAQAGTATAASPRNAIAVMTFSNITRDPSDDWIGSGIAETVSADLKALEGLSVVGRERIAEALRHLDAGEPGLDDRLAIGLGRTLGARWIVAGGYQRLGDQLRVTARFVEVETGAVLRNVKIDGRLPDIFALQDRIVAELTDGLRPTLGIETAEPVRMPDTRSIEAYELWSRGVMTLRLATRDSPDRAAHLFEQALALDPNYAEAWAGLAAAHDNKGTYLNLPEYLERAVEDARRAIAIDPSLGDAYGRLGSALFALGRIDECIAAVEQALRIDPRDHRALGQLARAHWIGQGDFERGAETLERAVELNPQYGWAHLQLAFLYAELGQLDRAEAAGRRAIVLQEQYISGEQGLLIVGAHTRLGYVFYRGRRYAEALDEYQRELTFLLALDHVLKERSLVELHQKIGAAHQRLGHAAEALHHRTIAIKGFEALVARGAADPQTTYYAAAAYALGGDTERAVRYFNETLPKLRAVNLRRAATDPDLESVRPRILQPGS